MEIRFSDFYTPISDRKAVEGVADAAGVFASVVSDRRRCVRFTLRKNVAPHQGYPYLADTEDHDRVIRALLTLDPDATVRTARAVYEGLEDFEKQRGK